MPSRGQSEAQHDDASPGAFLTLVGQLFSLAFQLCSDLLRFAYAILRPFAPQLISLVTVIVVLPILAFVSLSAGLVVWKTAAVSWEEPMFLQYGYVHQMGSQDRRSNLIWVLAMDSRHILTFN